MTDAIPPSVESPSPTRKNTTKDKNFFQKIKFRRSNSNSSSSSSSNSSSKNNDQAASPLSSSPSPNRRGARGRSRFLSRKNSKKKHKGNPNPTTIPEDSVLQPRRVIKASRSIPTNPYSASGVDEATDANSSISTSSSANNTNERILNVSKSIQDENLREKTEQWRKERLNATAALRKENKEKDIMQHRRNSNSPKKTMDGGDNDNVPNEIEVSEIFKTITIHPEHKRKVEEIVEDHGGDEKKLKVDDSADVDDSDEGKKKKLVVKKSRSVSRWMNVLVPAATVVAACAAAFALIMMKSMRKK